MLNELNVAFSFTIEASSHAYGYRKNEVLFTSDLYK